MPDKHVRQQIREAFKAILAGLPTTGANVFTGRVYALEASERPGLLIGVAETPGETSEVDSFGDAVKLRRAVPITIDAYDNGEDILDRLDRMALEIETAIAADWAAGDDSRLRALASDIVFTATGVRTAAEDKTRAGEIRLTWRVEYRTIDTAPQTATP